MKAIFKEIIVRILIAEAKILLRRHSPKIIAVTGSVGKTNTKDAIYAVLKPHIRTRKSQKSFNSEIGVPLSILGIDNAWSNPFHWLKNILDGFFIACFSKEYPSVLVLETGVDRPGDMSRLTSWINPDIVVLTRLPNVPTHIEFFTTAEEVVKEKMTLVHALKPDGVVVYNQDDEIICREINNVRQQAIGFSRYSSSHFTAHSDRMLFDGSRPSGLEFTLTHLEQSVPVVVRQSLGIQHAYSYAAAAAVGYECGVSLSDAATSLSEHLPPVSRMRLIRGVENSLVLDDSYNSSPVAAHHAVQTLKEIVKAKRKIAVLGDMLELGQFSVREHETVGMQVADSADILVTVGLRSRKIAEAALENGMSEKNIFQYDEAEEAARELRTMIQSGDVVLVKASQGIRLEKVVVMLMAEPEKAGELVARQDTNWTKKS